jgi:hypothetical protein
MAVDRTICRFGALCLQTVAWAWCRGWVLSIVTPSIHPPPFTAAQEFIMAKSFFQRSVSFSLAAAVTALMLTSVNFGAQSDYTPPQQWALQKAARA